MNIPRFIFHLLLLKSLEYMTNDTKTIYWQPVRKALKLPSTMTHRCSSATAEKTPTKAVCINQPYSRKEALCCSSRAVCCVWPTVRASAEHCCRDWQPHMKSFTLGKISSARYTHQTQKINLLHLHFRTGSLCNTPERIIWDYPYLHEH